MTDALPLTTDPESGLQYRLRPAAGRAAARLLLLHGVGGNETNLLNVADAIDPRIEIAFLRGPLTFGPSQHAWFPVRFGPNGPEIDAARADESRVQLVTLLHAFRAQDGAAPALPTVIAGFSQGGIMSASVG
ncbi:phospholipase, partial [Burkholderia cenocepacia]|nr:phospholipase [Burkholderia cenocepacia]